MTAKHSPATSLPWPGLIPEPNFAPQDAVYIVHAANAYPKLVEALRVSLRVSSLPFDHADKRANPERLRALLRELGEAE
jgi:hypothetical protein